MSTLQIARNTLLDELDRVGQLTAQAHTYISEAVEHYSQKPFWFNDEIATAQTVQDQEYLDLPDDWGLNYSLSIEIGSNSYPLKERTWQEMEDSYVSSSNYSGYPEEFCVFRNQLRLGPIPNSAYTLKMAYLKQPAELSAEGTTNIFILNVQELIRMRAGRRMARRVMRDEKLAEIFRQDEAEALQMAHSKTAQYQLGSGHTRKRK